MPAKLVVEIPFDIVPHGQRERERSQLIDICFSSSVKEESRGKVKINRKLILY